MTEPLDDARGELLARLEKIELRLLCGDQHDRNEANDIGRAVHFLRPAPVPQCEAEPVGEQLYRNEAGDFALRPVYAAPARCDPVAWRWVNQYGDERFTSTSEFARQVSDGGFDVQPLYAAPPSRSDAVNATPQRNAIWEAKIVADDLISIQEDLADETARDTLGMAAHYLRQFAALVPPPSEAGREALEVVRSAYYSEPTGPQENAWNEACQHIEEGIRALSPDPRTVAVASAEGKTP